MFFDSDLLIYMYLLHFRFTTIPLIFFMLLIIACTCMPESHYLIMYTCDCLSTPTGFVNVLAGLLLTILDPHVQILESGPWRPCCSWSEYAAETWISSCLSGPSFLPASPWSAREILILLLVSTLPYFIFVHPAFALLGDW